MLQRSGTKSLNIENSEYEAIKDVPTQKKYDKTCTKNSETKVTCLKCVKRKVLCLYGKAQEICSHIAISSPSLIQNLLSYAA